MQALHGGGVGGAGQADQQQLLLAESGHRVEPGQQQQGLWSGQIQQGFDHPGLQQHQLQQLHQQQQQQLQHQLLLGGHGNLAPLVGQQISQLLGPGQQHQSPPGLGPTLNMMMGGPHVSMGPVFPGQPVQSPPSSTGQFLVLPSTQQPRPAPGQDTAASPNSTPGLQTPTPSATPPIMNFDNRDSSLFMGTSGRLVTGQDVEQAGEMEQAMAWRGLQALQGGTLADMFPSMDRQMGQFGGMERQMGPGGFPGPMERGGGPAGYPGHMAGANGQGFNNYTVAMAQAQAAQAQENMMRLQQLQQSQEFLPKQHQVPLHQLQQYQTGPPMMAQPDMTRPYSGFPPPQCQSPSPNGFSLPPGPRPRPVGGDSSPPGYTPDTLPHNLGEDSGQGHGKDQEQQQLVIGSWNEEIDKETVVVPQPSVAPPPVHNMSQPPPRHGQPEQEWGGTFHVPRGGGHNWGGGEFISNNENKVGGRGVEFNQGGQDGDNRGKRGGRGGRGANQRGRGGPPRSDVDYTQEKALGKNSAIEETKAMMAKMRLEEKEMMSKYKKEKGIPEEEVPEENKVQPGAYRPRERRGRDDRKDGQRGRGGRGRGRGGPPMPCPGGQMPPMFGLPYVPGDFRTPPFPGMEGFLPPPGLGQFPPGFPPHFAPGFPPGIFPGPFPGDMRGRGGFPRGGRGFPIGFPPRGFPPPIIGGRGGRGGRGGYQVGGRDKEFRGEGGEDDQENPLLTAIEGNTDGVDNPEAEVVEQEQITVNDPIATPPTATAGVEVVGE